MQYTKSIKQSDFNKNQKEVSGFYNQLYKKILVRIQKRNIQRKKEKTKIKKYKRF